MGGSSTPFRGYEPGELVVSHNEYYGPVEDPSFAKKRSTTPRGSIASIRVDTDVSADVKVEPQPELTQPVFSNPMFSTAIPGIWASLQSAPTPDVMECTITIDETLAGTLGFHVPDPTFVKLFVCDGCLLTGLPKVRLRRYTRPLDLDFKYTSIVYLSRRYKWTLLRKNCMSSGRKRACSSSKSIQERAFSSCSFRIIRSVH